MKVWKEAQVAVTGLYKKLALLWASPSNLWKTHTALIFPSSIDDRDPRDCKRWHVRPTWLIRIGRPVARQILPFVVDLTLTGTEHLPATGAAILACNHASLLDPILLDAFFPRYSYFMSKQELFRHPLMAWFLRNAGAFPVNRSGGDTWAMRHAEHILQEGQVLGIFPEGTRSKQRGTLGKGKTGAVRLALEQGAPIIPVAILGTDTLLDKYRNPLRPPPVSVHIGTPIYVDEMVTHSPPRYEEIQILTTLLMERIAEMMPPEKRGEYVE
ncbi:MAG: 1-acyl-sn-glycerol-3-phosphate acyltransferase [Anaerolineae bacterium]|nr:1-acyl-sn-glycerol-3-phosphate acyltransferase [Anaerolineae bacterium]